MTEFLCSVQPHTCATRRTTSQRVARFWAKVELVRGARKFAFPDCWEWQGSRWPTGYGRILVNGKRIGTHRFVWESEFGRIPNGLMVLHKCDNRACVRPDHLFLGTTTDNMQDMIAKGRKRGSTVSGGNPIKLTASQVVEIRQRFAGGEQGCELATVYGVSNATISHIVTGETWRHAGGPITPKWRSPETASRAPITRMQEKHLRALRSEPQYDHEWH